MFDDIRRVGEKIDGVLGTDIFPFNYPFSHTENFLQHLEKWELALFLRLSVIFTVSSGRAIFISYCYYLIYV